MKYDFMRKKILRTQEAAADFVDCNVKTIWRMVRAGKLHPRPDGGFNKSELEPIKEAYYLKYRRHFAKEYGFVCKTLKELSEKTKIDIVILLIMKKKGFTSFQKNGYYYTKEAEIVYNQYQTQGKKSASDKTQGAGTGEIASVA
jgi:membrane-anchored protein YejM (alkaline phosphatase superfamily)